MEGLVNWLCREIELRTSETGRFPGVEFAGIYFGGCGPSLLSLDQLYRILKAVCDNLPTNLQEQGLLVLPGSVQAGKAKVLRESGFDRLELRVEVGQQYLEDFEILRAAGFASVGFEVGYSADSLWEEWLARLLELRPDTVVFYVPEGLTSYDLLSAIRRARRLVEGSFRCFLLHHYCRTGNESVLMANLCGGEVVGFGPGAVTVINGQRQQNELNTRQYVKRVSRGDVRRPSMPLVRADMLMNRLLRLEGISRDELSPDSLAALLDAELLQLEGSRLQLSEQGVVAIERVKQILVENDWRVGNLSTPTRS
ncbi:MAG: hypothetical protein ABIK43_03005 [candidate division WOR-3 bacterium]